MILLATSRRVLTQLRHDPRSVLLMVGVPSLLLVVLRYVFDQQRVFDRVAPALLGFFPFLLMFLTTSVTTLRERTSGTLERLLTTPASKLDIVGGYGLAFGLVAIVQVGVALAVSLSLGLTVAGPVALLLLVALLNALLGVALGLLASAFARTEFQAIQFMPVVVLPQLLLCGLLWPRRGMAPVLRGVADAMPLSYAVEALQRVSAHARDSADYWSEVGVVAGCVLVGFTLAAITLRRITP